MRSGRSPETWARCGSPATSLSGSGCASVATQLPGTLVDQHPVLPRPVHPLLEVGSSPESFQHEEAAEEVLGEEGHVRRIGLEVGRDVEQGAGSRVKAGCDVDEARARAAE